MATKLKLNVANIAERVLLNDNVTIHNDAADLIRDCVAELLSSLSCDALSMAAASGKRRVTGHDFVQSLKAFGYDHYVPPLEVYLNKWHFHNTQCEECSRLYPIPLDVIQEEEEEKAAMIATNGKKVKKLPYNNPTTNSSSTGIHSTDSKSKIIASQSDEKEVRSSGKKKNQTNAKTVKIEENNTTSKETAASSDAAVNGDGSDINNATAGSKLRGKKGTFEGRLKNPEFLRSLRERMSLAAQQPDPKELLKLLANEFKIPQKIVKDMFDQMMKSGELKTETTNSSSTDIISTVDNNSNSNSAHNSSGENPEIQETAVSHHNNATTPASNMMDIDVKEETELSAVSDEHREAGDNDVGETTNAMQVEG